ncbi:MAG: response regulator [Muribaculaceae bacterium]|nr:response regulator [Muribaculaceae bacterium]
MSCRKLLVVDDHPVVLEGMRSVLSAQGYEVLTAGSAEEAEALVAENSDIDLLVVDLTLRTDADGLELIRNIRTKRTGIPAVIYTMHEEMWNISMLIDADVEGVVLKGEDVSELLEGVRLVGKGAIYRSPEFCERFESVRKSRGILSQTDLDVLRLISGGLSTGEISKKINLSEKSVEYHRSNIIKKLGSKNMTEAICNAVKLGIISCVAAVAPFCSYAGEPVPQAVDLGLSVMWADRNLGAAAPLESGGYYAFGETSTKEYYDWDTYVHCDYADMFRQHFIGDESISGTQYDAAHVLLGEGWRMPTAEEAEELINACEFEAFEAEPIGYGRFTAPDGNFIDIPLAGYMSKGRLLWENEEADVWTGTLFYEEGEEDDFFYTYNTPFFLGFNSKFPPTVHDGLCQFGFPIRPVFEGTSGVNTTVTYGKTLEGIYTIDGRLISVDTDILPSGLYIYRYSDGTSVRRLK